jgi:hypothetical protein
MTLKWAPSLRGKRVCHLRCNESLVQAAHDPQPHFDISLEIGQVIILGIRSPFYRLPRLARTTVELIMPSSKRGKATNLKGEIPIFLSTRNSRLTAGPIYTVLARTTHKIWIAQKHRIQQLSHCYVLHSHYLTIVAFGSALISLMKYTKIQ